MELNSCTGEKNTINVLILLCAREVKGNILVHWETMYELLANTHSAVAKLIVPH